MICHVTNYFRGPHSRGTSISAYKRNGQNLPIPVTERGFYGHQYMCNYEKFTSYRACLKTPRPVNVISARKRRFEIDV